MGRVIRVIHSDGSLGIEGTSMWTLRLVSWSHRSLNLVTTPRESRDKIKFTLYKFETFCKNLNYLTNMWAQIPRLLTPLPPRHSFFFSDFIFIVATQNVSTDSLSTPSLWLLFSLVERTFRVIWRKRSYASIWMTSSPIARYLYVRTVRSGISQTTVKSTVHSHWQVTVCLK